MVAIYFTRKIWAELVTLVSHYKIPKTKYRHGLYESICKFSKIITYLYCKWLLRVSMKQCQKIFSRFLLSVLLIKETGVILITYFDAILSCCFGNNCNIQFDWWKRHTNCVTEKTISFADKFTVKPKFTLYVYYSWSY